ncbi:hypothetical protein ERX46_00220 [Brumimicrobium glaciale]|uniref:Uncharacterized protein n=1 Tax=Brumimicrobium glaciale TaxID=200475 RepID=A0A4Q4KPN3_9FLAO|nr:hypothetical protein [Brumimicrobium glaciale]RYM35450.1 hypothetical protein ERX46_00220 [Brumimicrobium glaciale]
MTGIILAFVFLICWLIGMVTMLRIALIKKKINSELVSIPPRYTYTPNTNPLAQSSDKVGSSATHFLRMIINFGSIKFTRYYVNSLINLSEIERLNHQGISIKTEKLIKLFSLFSRVWVIGIVAVFLAFILS